MTVGVGATLVLKSNSTLSMIAESSIALESDRTTRREPGSQPKQCESARGAHEMAEGRMGRTTFPQSLFFRSLLGRNIGFRQWPNKA